MDTIEKALNKHRQVQESELENDAVTAPEMPSITEPVINWLNCLSVS